MSFIHDGPVTYVKCNWCGDMFVWDDNDGMTKESFIKISADADKWWHLESYEHSMEYPSSVEISGFSLHLCPHCAELRLGISEKVNEDDRWTSL